VVKERVELIPLFPLWAFVACSRENFLPLTVKGEDHLEDLDVDGSLVQMDLKEDGRTVLD
jgi:hypothetical protein